MTWTAVNGGLSGDALNVNYIVIDKSTQHLPRESHVLYIATNDGVFKTLNGGGSWAQFTLPDPSNAEFSDTPAATVDELTFHWFADDARITQTFYVLAAKASEQRVWIYKSEDQGDTWTSRGVLTV